MRVATVLALGAFCLVAGACRDKVNKGFCRENSDCPTSQLCSQDLTQERWHRCFPIDGGGADGRGDTGAGPDGADAGPDGDGGPGIDGSPSSDVSADLGDGAGDRADRASDMGADVVDARVEAPPFACQSDQDCTTPGLPACDLATKKCAACNTNAHCSGTKPVCDTAAKVCVGCLTRGDCTTAAPACDTVSKTCVQCLARTDCTAARPVCDTASSTCVECLARADCPAGKPACDTANHSCAECLVRTDCGGTRPACDTTARLCVSCLASTDCRAPTAVCDTSAKSCVGCLARTDCGGTTPACDTTARTCVGCLARTDCSGPTPACDTTVKMCVGCVVRTDCGGATPACDTAAKMCVGCVARSDCGGTTPACDTTVRMCVGCVASSDCAAPTPVCNVATKNCVGCLSRTDCGGTKPACDTTARVCVGCLASTDCPSTAPVCDTTVRSCVQCLTSADCGGATPICEGQVCRACRADSECVARSGADPGVCMSHQDGRCASDAETIYVQNVAGCAAAAGATAGTLAAPYCRSQLAVDSVTPNRRLVVLRGAPALFPFAALSAGAQITVVGQNGATIAPGADYGVRVSAANVYVRNVRIAGGSSVGVFADAGATLGLFRVVVDDNLGGGVLLDSATFTIASSSLTNNGPGDYLGTAWGGLRVQSAAPTTAKSLTLVTVEGNRGPGMSCAVAIQGTGVLATGNSTVDISPTCGVTACTPAGPSCGAPP